MGIAGVEGRSVGRELMLQLSRKRGEEGRGRDCRWHKLLIHARLMCSNGFLLIGDASI